MSEHYLDNKKFLSALVDYKKLREAADEAGEEWPRASNFIGECFILLCNKIASRWNFSNYSYKDEMISAGIEICIRRIHNFDPEKSANPFGFFSRIVWRTFSDIIQEEHKQSYVKAKISIDEFLLSDSLNDLDNDASASDGNTTPEEVHNTPYFDWVGYEAKMNLAKEEKRKAKLEACKVVPSNALF